MKLGTSKLCVLAAAMALAGCAARPRPEWARTSPATFDTASESARQQADIDKALAALGTRKTDCDVLMLSSGGQTGAFGAGLIEGWTTRGDRPEFGLVTGVSTGALIAVFAFLGPDGDATLREMYTTHEQADVLDTRWWIELALADSYTRSTPLQSLVRHYISDQVVKRIGEAGARGRVLLVATSNMDLGRLRVWNLTALAGDTSLSLADRAARFRDIVMASMSIPVLMPPVFIDGHMHLDGGVVRQLLLSDLERADDLRRALGARPRFWVIANRPLKTPPSVVGNHMIPISARSVQLMMDANLEKDIEGVRRFAIDCGGQLSIAAVPTDPACPEPPEMFNTAYMKKLHDLGVRLAASGDSWRTSADHAASAGLSGPAALEQGLAGGTP